jgi:carbonic anhydrase
VTRSLPEFDDLLDGNRRFAAAFVDSEASKVPTRELVVLSCMDARVDPWRALGLGPGEAHILRNAGGRASPDAVRSIAVSAATLGTRRVAVVHHTDCGMLGSEEQIRRAVTERGGRGGAEVDFLTFTDLEGSIRDDVAALRRSSWVPDDLQIAGFLYDVATGQLCPVATD